MAALLTKPRISLFFMIVMAVVFFVCLVNLFLLRFKIGDVMPYYSSLRADPLGTRALYDSFGDQRDIDVSRNYEPLAWLNTDRKPVVFYLGLTPRQMVFADENDLRDMDQILIAGGRLVISFHPLTREPFSLRKIEDEKKDDSPKKDGEKKAEDESSISGDKPIRLERTDKKKSGAPSIFEKHWGFRFKYEKGEIDLTNTQARPAPGLDLPSPVSWHTILSFDGLAEPWRVVYTRSGKPVIIERPYGQGSVALSADTYLFSNEALRAEPHPELLAWFVGPRTGDPVEIIFDETHLGVGDAPNLAALAHKYGLYWPLAGLLILVVLYIWKNSVSLVPPPKKKSSGEAVLFASTKDSAAGLVSLLQRNLPAGGILKVCFEEWKKSFPSKNKTLETELEKIRTIIDTPQRKKKTDPVTGYRAICKILSEGRSWKKIRSS